MQCTKTTPGDLPASIEGAVQRTVTSARAEGVRWAALDTAGDDKDRESLLTEYDRRRAETAGAVSVLLAEICWWTDAVREAR